MSPLRSSTPLYGPLPRLRLSVSSTALCTLFNPLSSLQPSIPSIYLHSPLRPFVPLWRSAHPLRRSAPSTALCSLYAPLPPLWPSILSKALCFLNSPLSLYSPLSSLRLSVYFTAICPPQRPSTVSMPSLPSTAICTALYPLYGPLFPQQPSVFSSALRLLYSPYLL